MSTCNKAQHGFNCDNADINYSSALLCEEQVRKDVADMTRITTETPDKAVPSNTMAKPSAAPNKRNDKNLEEELHHLNRRIRHIQESIQFSSSTTALLNPQIWQENCLFAVKNCVNEWRNIANFHFLPATGDRNTDSSGTSRSMDDNTQREEELLQYTNNLLGNEQNRTFHDEIVNSTALKVFGLMQMALQVGPLKGSNPGYFKRCGSDVAKMAHDFLTECIGHTTQQNDDMIIDELRFTERQRTIIQKWIKNSRRAMEANKAPSKAALKLQKGASSKKSQKKKKNKAR